MTKAWYPADEDLWPVIVSLIPKPWPKEVIFQDLRFWENKAQMGGAPMPGRSFFQERWGVSKHRCAQLLYDKALWTSPFSDRANVGQMSGKVPAENWQASGTQKPLNGINGHKIGQEKGTILATVGQTPGKPQAVVPESSSSGALFEGLITNNNNNNNIYIDPPENTSDKLTGKAKKQEQFDESLRKLEEIYFSFSVSKKNKVVSNSILKCLKKNVPPEDIEKVIRWAWTSDHHLAKNLRDNKYIYTETPFRESKFDGYLAIASSESSSPSPKAGSEFNWSEGQSKLDLLNGLRYDPDRYIEESNTWPESWKKACGGDIEEFHNIFRTKSEFEQSQAKKQFIKAMGNK